MFDWLKAFFFYFQKRDLLDIVTFLKLLNS